MVFSGLEFPSQNPGIGACGSWLQAGYRALDTAVVMTPAARSSGTISGGHGNSHCKGCE